MQKLEQAHRKVRLSRIHEVLILIQVSRVIVAK